MSKQSKQSQQQEKKGLVPQLRFPEFRESGEWEEKTFGEIAAFINGRAYKQSELLENGKYLVLRVGNFFSNKEWYYSDLELEDNKYCEDGDLLYAWSASFGPRIWKGEKVIYHYHIWKVLGNEEVDQKFLFILLDCETESMKNQSANGLGLLHITKGAIESWKCGLPKLQKEQQKIAHCLSALDELISAQSQKVQALKAHKKGLMQQLFPTEGETVPKLRFAEFRERGEWEEKTFGEIAAFVNGRAYKQSELLENGKYRVLRVGNFFSNKEWYYSDLELEDNKYCEDGDLLYAWSASFGPRIWKGEKVIYHYHIWKVLGNKEVDPKFLFILLDCETESMKNQSANGLGLLHITKGAIESWKCCLPKLQKEQQKIAHCLSSLDELISAQSQKVQALKAHKKGLMQQLFPTVDD